ncbi:unnamed protein product, partial [Ceratitis capitata]
MFKSAKQKACIEMTGSKLKIRTNTLEQSYITETNTNDKNQGSNEHQLGGNILIGNYDFLKELEITDNGMEILDLSSLAQLEILTCNQNKLKELIINGKSLKILTAKHNNLTTIKSLSPPTKLLNIDISHNDFEELPHWLDACRNLNSLFGDHNRLWTMDNIFTKDGLKKLHTFSVAYNQLTTLNISTLTFGAITHLYFQSNKLQKLPDNFFTITSKTLKVLNVSCNNLCAVGDCHEGVDDTDWCLEELYLSNNYLNESIFPHFVRAKKLRVLHVAYNKIRELPEDIIRNWSDLEVLVLSGNKLHNLPENICMLTKLEVLRLHSNLLQTTPSLTKLASLKVLDLAHNQLDHVNLLHFMPKNIKYLDLSCNSHLQFDERQVQMCQSLKKMSLVDVSGKNRESLPTRKLVEMKDSNILRQPWTVGFTETTGRCRKLLVKQLRLCNFAEDEGLFGILETATMGAITTALVNFVPQILTHERSVKETAKDYMKYTLLSVYQRLACERACDDMQIALCHIAKESIGFKDYMRPKRTKRFVLRVASIGNIKAYLVRKATTICLTDATRNDETILKSDNCNNPANTLISDPTIHETFLSNDDEFLVICNANVWRVMDIDRVTKEIRSEENIVLAAKRLQDIAQSFGADENLSILIIRFRYVGTDVDDLLKELKKTVRKNPNTQNVSPDDKISIGSQRLIGRCSPRQVLMGSIMKSDRSSPSGQSDHAQNFLNKGAYGAEEYAFATEHVLEEDDDDLEILQETDSVLSEEQFKCWEYMLEQNTQLLFDKELNTISKSITKSQNNDASVELNIGLDTNDCKENKKPITTTLAHKHLEKRHQRHQQQQNNQQQVSFLSKHFGSCRSFQTQSRYNLFESKSQNSVNVGLSSKWSGGPNAAYFGSLQRLMPYNLEYDFTVTQDRSAFNEEDDEYSEQEDRMKQYWGIATTE